jgi:adenine-specific DNA-methyltransferase
LSKQIKNALEVLKSLGLPRAQLNDRSALTLLALLSLGKKSDWASSEAPLLGVTPIMNWVEKTYQKKYKPNTRETFRRQTLHQFVDAAIVLYNPDKPERPVNSPDAVYQVSPEALALLRTYGSAKWATSLNLFLEIAGSLSERNAKVRKLKLVPVKIGEGQVLRLSPGKHSQLIAKIIDSFSQRFTPGSKLLYAGDTGNKLGYFDEPAFTELGMKIDSKGKLPDVVLYLEQKRWLVLVEAVTSHGPVDAKRHGELSKLFSPSKLGLVYVTAFLDRRTFAKYAKDIAWETEVWIAESPDHMIHLNGERFLGPY